ncbi:hypothetical protein V6C03_00895 [Methyloligella sp. 2.7D]|uniref:hypothetical protein n=1 Tax=unclassified Methyloligella TaxID=2625955 RepID=UPI00157DCBE0|nr:hypothetical protein [Methyloligella sp. GL2]QKP76776.1 hypothetical protein HT051_04520 [Methyloligella sp. GL2]
MAKIYQPPKQSRLGQFIDCVFLIAIVYGSLMLPLLFNFGNGEETPPPETAAAVQEATWESLGQNAVMQQQWEKLGFDPASAGEIINDRFDYTIEPWSLGITAAILIGYFIFVLTFSEKEYREVIDERFGKRQR